MSEHTRRCYFGREFLVLGKMRSSCLVDDYVTVFIFVVCFVAVLLFVCMECEKRSSLELF